MKPPIGGILVLGATRRAHRKRRHRRVTAVIGGGGHDRQPRTAVRAIDERIPKSPIGWVEQLSKTIVAGGDVRRDENWAVDRFAAFDNVETTVAAHRPPFPVNPIDPGQRRWFACKGCDELVEPVDRSFDLDTNRAAVVADEPAET
jgi:hypothetical protein